MLILLLGTCDEKRKNPITWKSTSYISNSSLEEYLQELVGHPSLNQPSSHEQPQTQEGATPNFAHAALILQNSSNVYSRKVEYLHGLVYKALYEFFRSTTTNGHRDSRHRSTDLDIEEFFDFDPHVDFLLLDDVVPEDFDNHKINLKEDDDEGLLASGIEGTTPSQSLTRTRLSLGGLSVTRAEQRSSFGVSSSSQQRALLGTLNNGALRLVGGRCDVGDDGVLIMPGSSSGPSKTMVDPVDEGRRSLFDNETATLNLPQNDDYDDHDNDGPGFDFHGDNDDDIVHSQKSAGMNEGAVVALPSQAKVSSKKVTFAEPKKRADPWALLDPHASESAKQKPLRKGKTYRLPEEVDTPPSECVTGASTRRMPQRKQTSTKQEVRQGFAVETFRAFLQNTGEPPKIPIKGLFFGDEFAYIAKENAKKRAALRRAERKKELEDQGKQYNEQDDDDDDDDEYGGGFDFGGDDNDGNDEMGNAGMSSLDHAFQISADDNGEYGNCCVFQRKLTLHLPNFTICKGNDDTNFGKTFEELCRAHIQAFAKGAEDFALNTQLSERVNKWQAKLVPILEDEERRGVFDIHEYSNRIIEKAQDGLQRQKRKSDGSIQKVPTTVDFERIAEGATPSDVCRLFLASLSLANAGNVLIEEGAPTFRFDLLSNIVERPMETFQAPSLVSGV